jgi:hypothetical protein
MVTRQRQANFKDFSPADITAMLQLHKASEFTERIEAGEETSRNLGGAGAANDGQKHETGPIVINVLGKEALAWMEEFITPVGEEPPRPHRRLEAQDPQPVIDVERSSSSRTATIDGVDVTI